MALTSVVVMLSLSMKAAIMEGYKVYGRCI